jgi:PadR family transcriptional regulator, regulatory protein PadR
VRRASYGERVTSPGRHPEVRQPKRFLQPCLLLLIAESPAHGYELMYRLAAFGFERDPGGLYRELRGMERDGLVRSDWELSEAGPGRRRYRLTGLGRLRMGRWAESLSRTRMVVQMYLERYRIVVTPPHRWSEG